jgi:MFS family permease
MSNARSARLLTSNFLLLCVGSLFFYISFHILLPTLPTYILTIGGKEKQVGLIIGAFAASSLVFRLPIGWWLDRRGATKGLIVAGTLLFVASSALYSFTHSVTALLMVRLLHGSGMAAYATASSTLVAHITPPARRGEAMGVFGMAANLSMGLGPWLGVVLLDKFDYRTLFLASVAAASLGVVLALPIKDHVPANPSARTTRHGIFCAEALFPSLIIFAACLTYGIVVSFLPILTMRRNLGNPGSFFMVYALCLMLSRAPIGRLSDRFGRPVVIAPGMLMLAFAMAILAHAHSLQALAGAAALYALGFACVQSTLMAMAIDRVKSERRGAAMGLFTAGWELGIALGASVFGYMFSKGDYSTMFLAGSASAALGFVGFVVGHIASRCRLRQVEVEIA